MGKLYAMLGSTKFAGNQRRISGYVDWLFSLPCFHYVSLSGSIQEFEFYFTTIQTTKFFSRFIYSTISVYLQVLSLQAGKQIGSMYYKLGFS